MTRQQRNEKPYTKFVREYMSGYYAGESAKQIAKRLDTTEASLIVTAGQLRKVGVRIPRLNDRLDVSHLNKIIARARREAAPSL